MNAIWFFLLIIPLVHAQITRLNFLNPFRNILPKIQYYQLTETDLHHHPPKKHSEGHHYPEKHSEEHHPPKKHYEGNHHQYPEKHYDGHHHYPHPPYLPQPGPVYPNRLVECQTLRGFYLQGYCYLGVLISASFDDAVTFCKTKGGELWLPDLDNYYLFKDLIEATRGYGTVDFLSNPSVGFWVGIKNNKDLKNNLVKYYMASKGIGNCGNLMFDKGALYLEDRACTGKKFYACQIPL